MKAPRYVLLLAAGLLTACNSADQPPAQAPPAVAPAAPDTEAGRPVADADNLPAPSGDPHDDAPSVDVPTGPTPLMRSGAQAFRATVNGQPWPVDSVLAQSAPGLQGDYEEVTLRIRAGQPTDVAKSELQLRLPFTPENVAHVPVAIPLDNERRAGLLGYVRGEGTEARLWDAQSPQSELNDYQPWQAHSPQGKFTITALDRAARQLTGTLDVTFTTEYRGAKREPLHFVGQLTNVRY